MELGDYLLDTNVVINFLGNKFNAMGYLSFLYRVIDAVPKISIITKIEVLGYSTEDKKFVSLENFIKDSHIYGLKEEVVEKTIELRRAYKIKIPDAIIAATSMVHNMTLITSDKGFQRVKDLNVHLL